MTERLSRLQNFIQQDAMTHTVTTAVEYRFKAACLQESRKCNNVTESEGRRAWHLPVGSENLAATCWRIARTWASPGELHATRTSLQRTLTSHYRWVTVHVCLSRPIADPLRHPRVSLHLWSYFGLTFRVSLRLISLFSSISSCSLRAAENDRVSTHMQTYKIFGGQKEKRGRNTRFK